MSLRFQLLESAQSPLWDYGWFDRSRFKVEGPGEERSDWREVLGAFLLDPISRRTYCKSPDPWGGGGDHHGPYSGGRPAPESFLELTVPELGDRVRQILDDPAFMAPPSDDQRRVVDEWLADHGRRSEVGLVLEERLAPDASWERMVWRLYQEFVCFSADRAELTIAVLGYD